MVFERGLAGVGHVDMREGIVIKQLLPRDEELAAKQSSQEVGEDGDRGNLNKVEIYKTFPQFVDFSNDSPECRREES